MPRCDRSRHTAHGAACLALCVVVLAGCGGSGPAPPAPAEEPPALGSARQSIAEPPREPSAEIGLALLRKGDLRGAEPHLAGALKSSPKDVRILEALGSIYGRTDRFRQAEASLRAATAIEPRAPGAHLGLASVLVDTGRYDEARDELEVVRRLDPNNAAALVKSALLEARRGDAAAAAAAARQALRARPDDAEAHYVLGLALQQSGEIAAAADEMRAVLRLVPDHLGALSHLTTLATRRGLRSEAEAFQKRHAEALARRRVEERVRGHRLKGVEAFNSQDYATALQEFQTIAREDPRDPQVYLHLGSTYVELGRLEEGRAALRHCLSLEPQNERALSQLGRLEALAEHLDDAVALLNRAVAANPLFAEPHYYLAGIYRARGDAGRSSEEMRRFEDLQARSQGSASEIIPAEAGPVR